MAVITHQDQIRVENLFYSLLNGQIVLAKHSFGKVRTNFVENHSTLGLYSASIPYYC